MSYGVLFLGEADTVPNSVIADSLSKSLEKALSEDDHNDCQHLLNFLRENGVLPFEWNAQIGNRFALLPIESRTEYLLFRYRLYRNRHQRLNSRFPLYVLIEPASVCNLRCTMCFQVDKSFTKKPYMGVMDFDLFKKVIDQLVDGGTKAITFASRGEPTLHPRLAEMLNYCRGKFLEIKLNTNGTKLDDELIRSILDNGVHELVFSIDSHIAEIYEKIRVKSNFELVLENIRRFNNVRKEYGNSQTHTRVSGVKIYEHQDMERFTEFFRPIVDSVAYVEIENRWDTYSNSVQETADNPCDYLWERMYVWFDGRCNPCDVDYKSRLQVGDVNVSTIKEIWDSPGYRELRDDHLSGRRLAHVPCDRCGV